MTKPLLENPSSHTLYMREYLRIPANREKHRERGRAANHKSRADVFSHYGEACACCGESCTEFLTIDHVEGGGRAHRETINCKGGYGFYMWLRRNGYPSGYRTLCLNCNSVIRPGRPCPHERGKARAAQF